MEGRLTGGGTNRKYLIFFSFVVSSLYRSVECLEKDAEDEL